MRILVSSSVALSVALTACAGAEAGDDIIGSQGQAVIDGETPSTVDRERNVVLTSPGGGVCSGTLLRGNVVLTAGHCFQTGGHTCQDGCEDPDLTPGQMTVTQTSSGETRVGVAGGYAQMADKDLALLRLDTPLTMNGSSLSNSTQLLGLGDSADNFIGSSHRQVGAGHGTCGAGAGTLRRQTTTTPDTASYTASDNTTVYDDYQTYNRTNYTVSPGVTAWRSATSGDSGSSYILKRGSFWNWPISGVHLTSVKDLSKCPTRAGSLTTDAFRTWVHQRLGTWDTTVTTSFPSDFGLGQLTIIDPPNPISGPSSWSVSGGSLVQASNIHSNNAGLPGTMALFGNSVYANARIETTAWSNDDDAMGLVARYRDAENYYVFSVDQQRRVARIVSFVDGVGTVLSESDISINWDSNSTGHALSFVVVENWLLGYVNGNYEVGAVDSRHTMGTSGLYVWGATNARFRNFSVSPYTPP